MPAIFVQTRNREFSTNNRIHNISHICPLHKCQPLTWDTSSFGWMLASTDALASSRFPAFGLGRHSTKCVGRRDRGEIKCPCYVVWVRETQNSSSSFSGSLACYLMRSLVSAEGLNIQLLCELCRWPQIPQASSIVFHFCFSIFVQEFVQATNSHKPLFQNISLYPFN